MSKVDLRILEPNSVVLPDHVAVRRVARCPIKYRRPDFLERFDDRTLFYDVFCDDQGDLVMCGPPPWNLIEEIRCGEFKINDLPTSRKPRIQTLHQCSLILLSLDLDNPHHMDLRLAEREFHCSVGSSCTSSFAGSRTVMAINKDNDLEWIRDWMQFYVGLHGADSFLLFDNSSTAYDCSDLLEAASTVKGMLRVWVMKCPFKYGPAANKAGVWDSNFFQPSIFSLARYRFLSKARSVLSVDIDELVPLPNNNIGIFEATEQSATGYIKIPGHWIEAAVNGFDSERFYRHRDFFYRFKDREAAAKWCVCPGRCDRDHQWQVHKVDGMKSSDPAGYVHRHFRGVSTSWNYDRSVKGIEQVEQFEKDNDLIESYKKLGWI